MIYPKIFRTATLLFLCSASPLQLSPIPQAANVKSPCQVVPEDYVVYSALLNSPGGILDPKEGWPSEDVIIVDATSGAGSEHSTEARRAWGRRRREGTQQEPEIATIRNFYSKAGNSCPLQLLLNYQQGYRFITQRELDGIFKNGGSWWPGFYKKFPKAGGYWEFSLVGYNEAKNEAMVYVGHHCGGKCGTGTVYLLNQEHGRWSINNRLRLWIS